MKKILILFLLSFCLIGCSKMNKRLDLNIEEIDKLCLSNLAQDSSFIYINSPITEESLLTIQNMDKESAQQYISNLLLENWSNIYAVSLSRLSDDYANYEVFPEYYRTYLELMAFFAETYQNNAQVLNSDNYFKLSAENINDIALLSQIQQEIDIYFMY